jgi:hypothetical protein
MRFSSIVFASLIVVLTAQAGKAQENWVPQGIETLQESASSKSGFTFDHSMLVFASKLDPDNEDLRRVIAGVNGLSVRTYHFLGAQGYDRAALVSVNEEYRSAGWTRLLNKGDKVDGLGATDLWVRMQNNAVTNVALLIAKANEVKFVAVSGSISPIDLFHLCGHFGIPQIEGGVTIPNTRDR